MKSKFIAFFAAALFVGANAHAVTIQSVDRATFANAVANGDIDGQDFDALLDGQVLMSLDGVTYSTSSGEVVVTDAFLTSSSPQGIGSNVVDSNGIPLEFFLSGETVTFTFATAITAFAIDVNTFATGDGAYTATLGTGDVVTSLSEVFPSQVTGQFIGFVTDSPFMTLTIAAATDFSFTLDSLVFGLASDIGVTVGDNATVPLPAAGWMMLIGMAALARVRRNAR